MLHLVLVNTDRFNTCAIKQMYAFTFSVISRGHEQLKDSLMWNFPVN